MTDDTTNPEQNRVAAACPNERLVMLRYSKNVPTEPGWYWIKSDFIGNGIVEVFYRPGHKYLCIYDPGCCQHTKRNFYFVGELGAEWAGPIPEPQAT
jgi:hypothetical protein